LVLEIKDTVAIIVPGTAIGVHGHPLRSIGTLVVAVLHSITVRIRHWRLGTSFFVNGDAPGGIGTEIETVGDSVHVGVGGTTLAVHHRSGRCSWTKIPEVGDAIAVPVLGTPGGINDNAFRCIGTPIILVDHTILVLVPGKRLCRYFGYFGTAAELENQATRIGNVFVNIAFPLIVIVDVEKASDVGPETDIVREEILETGTEVEKTVLVAVPPRVNAEASKTCGEVGDKISFGPEMIKKIQVRSKHIDIVDRSRSGFRIDIAEHTFQSPSAAEVVADGEIVDRGVFESGIFNDLISLELVFSGRKAQSHAPRPDCSIASFRKWKTCKYYKENSKQRQSSH
jgi:hypothetical protein